jgi:hypothetical protein
MRRLHRACSIVGAACLAMSAVAPAVAAPCDEYDPTAPGRTASVTLTRNDSMGPGERELRTFVATGSIGKVDVVNISASPRGDVRAVSAVPEISRLSPHYGEQLRGIAIVVTPTGDALPAKVVVTLRQVCAQYFRDTFLYY